MFGNSDALIVVDMQNDFVNPKGQLYIPKSESIIGAINQYIRMFREKGFPVFYTRDWHPINHISFQGNGGPWKPHCIQNRWGARFVTGLDTPSYNPHIISKGFQSYEEAYSAFKGTLLHLELTRLSLSRLHICGVATEYCVKETVNDACEWGYGVSLLVDGIAGLSSIATGLVITELMYAGAFLKTMKLYKEEKDDGY
jgi:nicotinamidase/pyrazinamidase